MKIEVVDKFGDKMTSRLVMSRLKVVVNETPVEARIGKVAVGG